MLCNKRAVKSVLAVLMFWEVSWAFKARDSAVLESDADKILGGFGSDCRMTFS